jgi:Rps23 Pro-64 3,4-dihydroxylase Tpa1-like proline 4-hydroxylase
MKRFYDDRNGATRIDLFDELSQLAQAALRAFFRRMNAPHLFDEVMVPLLDEGDSQVFAAVRDRPWPPWGLGARYVTAVCQTHLVADTTYGLSPVYVADEDLCNIGLVAAVYKEAVEYLALSVPDAEINYLLAEGSIIADLAFRKIGFERTEDVFLTEASRYFTYRMYAKELLNSLGLDAVTPPDLLAHEVDPVILERNAFFHGTIYAGSRAEWTINSARTPSEIIQLVRGGHFSKPGGVPTGTGRFAVDPALENPVVLPMENFLTAAEYQEFLDYIFSQEAKFESGTIIERGAQTPVVNERVRRAKTLDDLGQFETIFAQRIKENLSEVLRRLKYEPFPIDHIELQITASGDGDYFRIHQDRDENSTREITFVYFLYREPRRFSGGELRVFETTLMDGRPVPTDQQQTLAPSQNLGVFFPSRHEHEVLPTRVPTKAFADSRFTVTGWIHGSRGKG